MPKGDLIFEGDVVFLDGELNFFCWWKRKSGAPNLRLTFDEHTGYLKYAEVLRFGEWIKTKGEQA